MNENPSTIFEHKRTLSHFCTEVSVLTEILALAPVLHPEDSKLGFLHWSVEGGAEAQAQHFSAVSWVDHAIIPKTGTTEVWTAFSLKPCNDWFFESVLLLLSPLFPLPPPLLLSDCGKHSCRLLPSHHRDPGVWPHEEEPGVISSATHPIIASTIAPSHNKGQFWHLSTCHSSDKFGSMLCNSSCLCLLSHHEAGDVLQKQKWDVPLAAELNEVGSLEGTFSEENTIVS